MCILMVLLYITNINIVEAESCVPGFGITLLSEKPVKSLLLALVKQKVISGYQWKIEAIDCDRLATRNNDMAFNCFLSLRKNSST